MTAPSRSRERWIAVGQSGEADAWAAGAAATRQALDGGDGRLLVVFCSDSYDPAALLAGIDEASGGVPLIGCSTAGEIATSGPGDASLVVVALGGTGYSVRQTSQLYGAQVLHDAVVAAAVASDAPFGIGVRHGWRKMGEAMLVTYSANNRVYSLDDQPALDVYLDRLNAPEEVRFIGEANFEDRSLGCIAEVPQGGLSWFMEGDEDSVLEATDTACADALRQLDGRPAAGLLAFDCIARRGVLGEEGIRREIERVAEHAGGAPVAGFYTYGGIARIHGISGFHNQTLVVLALS